MPPPIPYLKIIQIDQGSPIIKPDEIPDDSLLPPPFEFFVTELGKQIISSISSQINLSTDKGKLIFIDSESPMMAFKKSEGLSKEQLKWKNHFSRMNRIRVSRSRKVGFLE